MYALFFITLGLVLLLRMLCMCSYTTESWSGRATSPMNNANFQANEASYTNFVENITFIFPRARTNTYSLLKDNLFAVPFFYCRHREKGKAREKKSHREEKRLNINYLGFVVFAQWINNITASTGIKTCARFSCFFYYARAKLFFIRRWSNCLSLSLSLGLCMFSFSINVPMLLTENSILQIIVSATVHLAYH